ncbi:MAG: Cof-type HAD-IIB family hydrolase [Oscillospiraceae bacterium]|nr:Cof-type HAD-IIB family hydrolase [Oscillospiraceae bacterium]
MKDKKYRKYKLIAVDIDGTLLNSRSELTSRTQQAIYSALDAGVIFVVSTGRPLAGVEHLVALMDADLPFITYNGAVVVMGKSKRRLFSQMLPEHLCREVVELGIARRVAVLLWRDAQLYAPISTPKNDTYIKISRVTPMIEPDLDKLVRGGADKMLWCDGADRIYPLQNEMWEHFAGRLNCHTSHAQLLEFVDIGVSKARAMEKLGALYGIGRDEMMAIGDGYNDLSMIKYAGLGVAMANAVPEVLKEADFITRSNDEDGVAHVIDTFVSHTSPASP